MAQQQFDATALLDALQDRPDLDLVREMVAWLYQALIDAEATEVIGAEPHERSIARTTRRNGHRSRTLSSKAGDLELKIPKLRKGSFFPSVLERRRRIDQALYAVVMEAYVHGVSTRKVDDLVQALGIEAGISRSEVSRICAEMDTELEAFRQRPLDHVGFPYVFCDATYVKARVGGRVVSRAVVVATGVTETGDREVLGLSIGDSEDKAFWTEFLQSLRARGLGGVQLVVSDHHLGLKGAIAKVFVGASWQRCRVHYVERRIMWTRRPAASLRLGASQRRADSLHIVLSCWATEASSRTCSPERRQLWVKSHHGSRSLAHSFHMRKGSGRSWMRRAIGRWRSAVSFG